MTSTPYRVARRVLDHADLAPGSLDTLCLISRYSVGSHGYAQVGWREPDSRRVVTLAHLALWRFVYGDLAAGVTVDHRCHARKCVRLNHLRELPNLENARRTAGRDWPIGRCAHGHEDALYWRPKGPERLRGYCSACHAQYK